MSGWNPREGLVDLVDPLLEITLGISELLSSMPRHAGLDRALYRVICELCDWGLHEWEDFKKYLNVRLILFEVVKQQEGDRAATLETLFQVAQAEYKNLQKILAHDADADLARGHAFCCALAEVALRDAWAAFYGRRSHLVA